MIILQLESLGTSLGDLKSDFRDLSLGQKKLSATVDGMSVRLASVERMQGALYENELRREVAK